MAREEKSNVINRDMNGDMSRYFVQLRIAKVNRETR